MHNLDNNKPNENSNTPKKFGMKHGLMMMLCCLIPILLIAGLPLFGFKGGALSGLIFLLCPLMHIGMMVFMMKGKGKNSCHNSDENKNYGAKVEE